MRHVNALSRVTLSALVLGVLMPLATSSSSAGAGVRDNVSWLAAGDSYASGAGLPHTNSLCAQGTGKNGLSSTWAMVAARKLSAEGWSIKGGGPTLVACTGAISDEFFTNHTGVVGGSHPQQWHASMGRFNLVTFSFGGDDLGFASILQHCLSTGCPPDAAVRSKIHQLATTGVYKGSLLIPSFPVFLNHVANAAVTSRGNVIVMGYPEIFEDPSLWPAALKLAKVCQGFLPGQVALIRGWAGDLNATLGQVIAQVNAEPASKRNGVHFTFIDPVTGEASNGVSPSDPNLFEPAQGTRHELCSDGDQVWLNGLSPAHPTTRSYHPDQAGNNAMGALAAQVISRQSRPMVTLPPYLAVGTRAGMELWSAATGARPVGPVPNYPVNVYDINWSANGKFLAWIQGPSPGTSAESPELVEYNVLSHRYHFWISNDPFVGLVPEPGGIVAAVLGTPELIQFDLNLASPKVITLPVSALTSLSPYDAGFLASEYSFPVSGPSGKITPIFRVSVAGMLSPTRAVLPAITSASSPGYEVTVPSPSGDLAAIELGDHTDLCGVGPSSKIFIANTLTGKVTSQGPPAPTPAGATRRVNSLAWSPSGILDATMLYCGPSWSGGLPTELWENAGHGWHKIGGNIISAARGPDEVLATVTGHIGLNPALNFPSSIPAGPQKLYIGGKWVPLNSPAHEIAWSP